MLIKTVEATQCDFLSYLVYCFIITSESFYRQLCFLSSASRRARKEVGSWCDFACKQRCFEELYVYVEIEHVYNLCKECKLIFLKLYTFLFKVKNGSRNKQELTVMCTNIITQISSTAVLTGSVPFLSVLSSAYHRYTHQIYCCGQG